MISGLALIEKELHRQVTDQLDKVGILYRIFSRVKDSKSISEKIKRKEYEKTPYKAGMKLMQDIIGIRVVTYFKDDVDIVYSILKTNLHFFDEEIDKIELTVFKPKRTNIICKFNKTQSEIFNEVQSVSTNDSLHLIDNTFELQLRTILSEGWHEIDHSLRYKCKKDWENHLENERLLNGIYASLETNDIALKNLFNELAFKHYKNKNWEGLLRNKFRLRFQQDSLDNDLKELLDNISDIGKQIFKVDRAFIIYKISEMEISIPVNLNNILFLINVFYLKNAEIFKVTPKLIIEEFQIRIN